MTEWDDLAKASIASGRVGQPPGLPSTPKQQQEAKNDAPVYTGLSNILSAANVPGGAAGAFLRDIARGRPLGFGRPPSSDTAETHFGNVLFKQGPAAAVNEYFATSPSSMKEYSKGAGAIAAIGQHFVKHPKQNAALDFVGRILDPGNALTLETVAGLNAIAKDAVRTAARAGAKAIIKHAPEAAAHPAVRALQSLENLPSGDRFAEVQSAGEDIARAKGWNPKDVEEHGNAANVAARNIANSGKYAKGMAQKAANDVFKGLTKQEQFHVVDMIENNSPLLRNPDTMSASERALRAKLLPRVTAYRGWRHVIDEATKQFSVADEKRLWGDNFFSRSGMFVDPQNEAAEELLPQNEAFRREFSQGSGVAVRPGSLKENLNRKFITMRDALKHGMQLRTDMDPMRAFEMHVYARTQAARINEQLNKLQELGLIIPKKQPLIDPWFKQMVTPKEGPAELGLKPPLKKSVAGPRKYTWEGVKPQPEAQRITQTPWQSPRLFGVQPKMPSPSVGLTGTPETIASIPKQPPIGAGPSFGETMIDVPQPPGFADFSSLGSMKQFGSNITRDAWVHPSVPSLIEDVAATHTTRKGLAHVLPLVGGAMRTANRILSATEVSNPGWHPAFNISENIASEAPNPLEMARGMSRKAVEQAEQEGVHVPFSRRQAASEWGRPFNDLSPKEKLMRILMAVPHGVESFASAPLYTHIEPWMATAAHAGLKGRMGPAGATLAVRSMLGEPENLGAATQDVAPLLQFPAWMLSQLRRWPKAMLQRPYLYNAPHAAIRDVNAMQGRSPKSGDESKMFPPIVLGRDKNGDFTMLNIPHPGNRASELGTALLKGDKTGIAYALAGGVNPMLQQPVWQLMGFLSSDQKRNLAMVAPQVDGKQQALDFVKNFGRFSPIRSLTSKELSPERQAASRQLINAFLYGHGGRHREAGLVEIRMDQSKAERAGDTANAQRLRKIGDDMYNRMVQSLTSQGFPAP